MAPFSAKRVGKDENEIPNRAFLVRFDGILGLFGLAMGILTQLRIAKIRTMARPNLSDIPPKQTKKVRLSINITVLVSISLSVGWLVGLVYRSVS